jgi:CrcB protein
VQRFFLVCFGGALGSGARYLLTLWASRRFGAGFPWGTFGVNVLGCFLVGVVLRLAAGNGAISSTMQLALTAGFLGGFTTYSAFNQETIASFERGAWTIAGANLFGTVVACLVAGFLGHAAGRALAGS